MNYRKYLIQENKDEDKKRINTLYNKYKKKAKGDADKLHSIIKNDFVNNTHVRNSNDNVTMMWSLYKSDFPS